MYLIKRWGFNVLKRCVKILDVWTPVINSKMIYKSNIKVNKIMINKKNMNINYLLNNILNININILNE